MKSGWDGGKRKEKQAERACVLAMCVYEKAKEKVYVQKRREKEVKRSESKFAKRVN